MQDISPDMEFTAETVEVEEICEDGVPTNQYKKVVKAFDSKFVTDWKNDPNYKNWVDKTAKENETVTVTAYQYDSSEPTECIEVEQNGQKRTVEVVKTVPKANPRTTAISARNNRGVKRQITVMDPNLPAFVCTEHNENISLDCRYCRIASGFKKKNAQKSVQNDEISSSGKVTVVIPKRESGQHSKTQKEGVDVNAEAMNSKCTVSISNVLQKNQSPVVASQKIVCVGKTETEGTKEEIFGRYVASELKRIKSKKTYEEVKWKILQALQTAADKEADDLELST